MQKNVKRMSKVSVILVFLMMFSSCVKDDFYEKESAANFNGASVKHYDGSQARTLISRFKQGILSSTKFSLSSQEGVVYRTMNEVSISEDEVMEVKDTLGNVNYTFRVEGLSQRGSGEFYNIVINNRDGKERAFLLKYVMDPKFQTEYEAGNSSIEMFRGILFIASLAGNDNPCDENIVVPVVPGTGGGGGGGEHGNGGVGVETGNGSYNNGGGLAYIQEVVYQLAMGSSGCEPPPGGCEEDDVWEDCACWRYVSVSPRFFRVGNFPVLSNTPDPCDDGTIGVIGVLIDKNHEKNCEELNKMSFDGEIKAKIQELQGNVGNSYESGYSFKNENGNTTSQVLNLANGSFSSLDLKFEGNNTFGFSHIHPDPKLLIYDSFYVHPMFSLDDIYKFHEMISLYMPGAPKNFSMFFATITVKTGNGYNDNATYALKIDNWFAFNDFWANYSLLTEKKRSDLRRELSEKYDDRRNDDGAYSQDYIEDLLMFMNDKNMKGISVYKANDTNLSGWKKQVYNKNTKKIEEIPCN